MPDQASVEGVVEGAPDSWLGIPVIAINAAIWEMALRDNDIPGTLYGFGGLLRDF